MSPCYQRAYGSLTVALAGNRPPIQSAPPIRAASVSEWSSTETWGQGAI